MVAKAAHESRNDSTRSSFYAMIYGKKIFIEVDGKGPFMIMTHGLGASSNVFQPLTEVFSCDYTVVRLDWPGLGMTGLAPEYPPLSVPGFLKDLEGVMDHLKIESAILVGHSLGGIISMHFAAKYPARVSGLAVIGAGRTRAVDGKSRDDTLRLAKITRQIGVWARVDDALSLNIPSSSPALARALLRQVTATTEPEGYAQVCEALTDESHIDPEYSQITCSTCVVGGVHDQIAPVEVTHELYSLISQSGRTPHLCMLKTGHMQVIEDVDGVAEAIRKMLAGMGLVESRYLVYFKRGNLLKYLEAIQSGACYAPLGAVYTQSLGGGGAKLCSSTVSECSV